MHEKLMFSYSFRTKFVLPTALYTGVRFRGRGGGGGGGGGAEPQPLCNLRIAKILIIERIAKLSCSRLYSKML